MALWSQDSGTNRVVRAEGIEVGCHLDTGEEMTMPRFYLKKVRFSNKNGVPV